MKRCIWIFLVCGCSTVEWEKPGGTPAALSEDLLTCSAAAQSAIALPQARTTSNEVRAGLGGFPVLYIDVDRQLLQERRIESCMRAKGYSLQPQTQPLADVDRSTLPAQRTELPLPAGKQCTREVAGPCADDAAKACKYVRIEDCG